MGQQSIPWTGTEVSRKLVIQDSRVGDAPKDEIGIRRGAVKQIQLRQCSSIPFDALKIGRIISIRWAA